MDGVSRLLADYGPAFGQALLLTWKLTFLSFVPGFLLGIVVTVLRLLPLPPLRLPQVKFLQPVLPGQAVQVCVEGEAPRWRFRVLRDDSVVASGEVVAESPAAG